MPKNELYKEYAKWCEENNEYQVTQRRFGQQLSEHLSIQEDKSTGGIRIWRGIGLIATEK